GINAFALGAQLTNPNARIQVKWDCIPGDPLQELIDQGVDYVSTLDTPHPRWGKGQWGAFRILLDGLAEPMATPYWDWGTFYVKLVRSIMNGEWNSAKQEAAINYWWGMPAGVIGLKMSEDLPEGVKLLADILQQGIIDGSILPFKRTIFDQAGILRSDGSVSFSPEELLHMDWLCSNVDGSIPSYDMLTPKGQAIVRLQGLYRDEIPPEKEGILL
ncbi:MAG: BMP family ABC transporter substrate-binding protein, partial [Oscillospiraceae bacterium]|nr:BMP family ABC transporter substrate-binding protein [Oscillospiraceae bacterium]